MKKHTERPSERIEQLLTYIAECKKGYDQAKEQVKAEESKLQDFLHEIEFTPDKNERNRLATQLQQSRRIRRQNKDRMQELEFIINFYADPANRKILNSLRQLLKNQKAREEYLYGERHYKKRFVDEKHDSVRVHPEDGSDQQNVTA